MEKIDNTSLHFLTEENYFKETSSLSFKMNIFQTREWFLFLKKTVNGKPVFIKITDSLYKYYIYGFIIKKFGLKIFASPFEQWTTSYIGFLSNADKIDYSLLINLIYKHLRKTFRIFYMQLADYNFEESYLKSNKIKYEVFKTQIHFLTRSETELKNLFEKNVKKRINNYSNHGYEIRKVEPNEQFVDRYYEQLIDVFKLQNLEPFYKKEKVINLIDSLKNTNNILCLESYDNNTNTILGSAISFGLNNMCITWGSASYTATKTARMNHPVRYETMRYWKERGCYIYDFGGYNKYKNCFRPETKNICKVYKSVMPGLHFLKIAAKKIISVVRKKKI